MSRFHRVKCAACGALCLPEHAPEYVVVNPHATDDDPDYRSVVRLCRVPVIALGDGGLGFAGCGSDLLGSAHQPRLIADPFIGVRAHALHVAL